MSLTKQELKALADVSSKLDINPFWLYTLIQFESKWNPKAKNPNSTARGLIQFVDSTAQALGYKNSQELIDYNPTIESQLRYPVYNYLKEYRPFPTRQSLYMAVFYPAARSWPVNTRFPQKVIDSNPGIDTVQMYMDKVEKKNDHSSLSLLVFSALSLIIFLLSNKKHKKKGI
jgi:hypothetical protein